MTNNWSQDAAVGVSRGQGLPPHTHHRVKISTDFSMSKIYLLHLEVDFRRRRFFLYYELTTFQNTHLKFFFVKIFHNFHEVSK